MATTFSHIKRRTGHNKQDPDASSTFTDLTKIEELVSAGRPGVSPREERKTAKVSLR